MQTTQIQRTLDDAELEPCAVGARSDLRRSIARLATVNMLAASGAAIIAAGAIAAAGWMKQATNDNTASVRGELTKTVDSLVSQSKATDQLEEMMRIAATVTRAGGWIRDYRYKNGQSSFVVVMPEWVTRDYVDALGPEVIADIDRGKGVIEFKKGRIDDQEKQGAGRTTEQKLPAARP